MGIIGFRSSHPIAYLLYLLLSQVRKNCDLLEFTAGSLANQIIHYGPGDLLIGVSLPRYSRQTFGSLQYAKKNGCRTLAITDSPISPIGQIAHQIIFLERVSV